MSFLTVYFFIYAFAGWIYESIYVSAKLKKITNRGFMHGPIIPIYGFGGLIFIMCGIYTGQNLIKTVISAVIICTLMELFTGVTMEKLFKVRYWNYDKYPHNIRGYICPRVSTIWALMGIFVFTFIHPLIREVVISIPINYLNIFSYISITLVLIDTTISYFEAIDLRATYEEFADNNKTIILLQKKLDNLQNDLGDNLDDVKDKLSEMSVEARNIISNFKQNGNIYLQNSKQVERLSSIKNRLSNIDFDRKNDVLSEIDSLQNRLRRGVNKKYKNARNILRRNPESISTRIEEQIKKNNRKN
jgi:uncharacterized membrane protein